MNTRTKLIIATVGLTLMISGVFTYFLIPGRVNNNVVIEDNGESDCLKDNEHAEHSLTDSSATITLKDKSTDTEISSFVIKDIIDNHYHPLEIHKCGVYTFKTFNYNISNIPASQIENFQIELWKYNYAGQGEKKILLTEQVSYAYKRYYDQDFRVSPNEKYIALESGYLGADKYYLVIKDLSTLEDVFVLDIVDLYNKDPERIGTIGFNEWTKDSRYFWIDLFNGANVNAFVRIDTTDWSWEYLPAPENTMGGDKLNPETGWVTHNTLGIWTGETDISQQIKERYQKEGKTGVFAIYNLFTKQGIILETATDPTYFFKPKWLSDTELEYEMSSGERKVYTIK